MPKIKNKFFPRKLFIFLSVLLILALYYVSNKNFKNKGNSKHEITYPLLIWWKPMTGLDKEYTETRFCGVNKCTFSNNRDYLYNSAMAALLFYGSELDVWDFPLPRFKHHIWALLHEESPRNVPFISHSCLLQHFNFTSTMSRYSDLPLTTIYLHDIRELTAPTFLVPVGKKTVLQQIENLAPIAFLQSDCDTSSERDLYVKELMQHVKVDSFGSCLHNRDLPDNLSNDYLSKLYSPKLYRFLSRYKFILAYENGVCHDYITEKFWRPLLIGSIPIYFGSPTIKDWEPNAKSVIHITDFTSPKSLADFVKSLNSNDSEYNSFLGHKYNQKQPISNRRLQRELTVRDYSPISHPNLMSLFECFICKKLHENKQKHQMAKSSHYDCPYPPSYPPMGEQRSSVYSMWKSIMAVGKCQAEIINELLQRNLPFSKNHFNHMLDLKVQRKECD